MKTAILLFSMLTLLITTQSTLTVSPRHLGLVAWKTFQLWCLIHEAKKWCKEKEKKKIALIAATTAMGTYDGNSALTWYQFARDSIRRGKIKCNRSSIIKSVDWHHVKSHPIDAAGSLARSASEGIEKAFLLLATLKAYEKLITNGWLKRSCWFAYHGMQWLFLRS